MGSAPPETLKTLQQFDCRCVSAAEGKSEFGLYGVADGMTVIVVAVFTMRLFRGSAAEVSVK